MQPASAINLLQSKEGSRLHGPDLARWRRWGPYLSDRQWGTVREDYSEYGTAWDYFPHDHARSRMYRWGEDGIAGFGNDPLDWCVSLALWNGHDPIIKERLFGLTNAQGNHGEDVKELYFYLDGTPTHSYMKMLYKYPHHAYPYQDLIDENARRGADQPEYEVLDTGVFDDNRYFDVWIEYAKHTHDDIVMRVTVENRSDQPGTLHVLPQFWARNRWAWSGKPGKPSLTLEPNAAEGARVIARNPTLDTMIVTAAAQQPIEWLFCENETNSRRIFGIDGEGPFKDGFNDYLVDGDERAIRRDKGTRAAAHSVLQLGPHGQSVLYLRWRPESAVEAAPLDMPALFTRRQAEADEFYAALQHDIADADARLVQRQALAGMLWSKQYYQFDVTRWHDGDPGQPVPPKGRRRGRNADWRHMCNGDIVSMPDKWEYPWYASWDLAFHAVAFAVVDPDFAKKQLQLLVKERYMHPNGQLPAYEWAFGDANPPVHAWATWRVYELDREITGVGDHEFLEVMFHKLLLNFSWWVNRKDADDRNIFQGGFLGLDNIGIFDRSSPLPTGGRIDQADGTAWMASYALDLMQIGLELAMTNTAYVEIAVKFFEHFLYIAEAVSCGGEVCNTGLWDGRDEFFYDVLHLPDGARVPMRIRSIVGLIPLFAVHVLDEQIHGHLPGLRERLAWFLDHRPNLARLVSRWTESGKGNTSLLSLLRGHRMKSLLKRALNEDEFLSPYGVRALSRVHLQEPYVFDHDGVHVCIEYQPAESDSRVFGGNSNWRGPVWIPVNYLLIESLYEFHRYYGDEFRIEHPTGSDHFSSLSEVADDLARRVTTLFMKNEQGVRPVMAAYPMLQADPRSQDLILFHEYFHGDNGRGVGASHQTGWTGLVALLLQPRMMRLSHVSHDAVPVPTQMKEDTMAAAMGR